jgi:hypothetical protein
MSREQIIRDTAYAIWEAEGKPSDRAMQHWKQAEERVAASLTGAAKPPAKGKVAATAKTISAEAKPPAKTAPAKKAAPAKAAAAKTASAKTAATKAAPAKSASAKSAPAKIAPATKVAKPTAPKKKS